MESNKTANTHMGSSVSETRGMKFIKCFIPLNWISFEREKLLV